MDYTYVIVRNPEDSVNGIKLLLFKYFIREPGGENGCLDF